MECTDRREHKRSCPGGNACIYNYQISKEGMVISWCHSRGRHLFPIFSYLCWNGRRGKGIVTSYPCSPGIKFTIIESSRGIPAKSATSSRSNCSQQEEAARSKKTKEITKGYPIKIDRVGMEHPIKKKAIRFGAEFIDDKIEITRLGKRLRRKLKDRLTIAWPSK